MANEIDTRSAQTTAPEFERWVSEGSRDRFAAMLALPPAPSPDVTAQRAHYDAINRGRLDRALERYDVTVSQATLGGVPVHLVAPKHSRSGTLLCLHGGAFIWGAGAGAVLEAVPVAATTGMRVVAVEYRLAPENLFPAAVDDVLSVLSAIDLDDGEGLGIYGCSAGAVLTAQVVARLIVEQRRLPDAIALLHGSGVDVGGDSLAVAGLLNGKPEAADIRRMHDLSYFAGTSAGDPLAFPGEHPELLAAFPPSLLISGTRDFAASGTSVMHRRLIAQGVYAQFVLFDGMWHAHHVDVELPESEEVYAIMRDFFDRHLS